MRRHNSFSVFILGVAPEQRLSPERAERVFTGFVLNAET
jgi:hypothetical protein